MMNDDKREQGLVDGHDEVGLTAEERAAVRAWSAGAARGEERVARMAVVTLADAARESGAARGVSEARGGMLSGGSVIADGSASRPYPESPYQLRRMAWQAAAAVVIFASGFYLGHARGPMPGSEVASVNVAPGVLPAPGAVSDGASLPVTDDGAEVAVTPPDGAAPEEDCAVPQLYKDNTGHLRMDTVLCGTGNRATWVINPTLEIANVAADKNQEEVQ